MKESEVFLHGREAGEGVSEIGWRIQSPQEVDGLLVISLRFEKIASLALDESLIVDDRRQSDVAHRQPLLEQSPELSERAARGIVFTELLFGQATFIEQRHEDLDVPRRQPDR